MKKHLLLAILLFPSLACASVSIIGTRVIYNESNRSVTVKINNRGDMASVVQAWIDDKMINQAPNEGTSPFLLYPAVSKIESNGEQYLRIKKIESITNTQTESLYWLNIKDIPEAPKNKNENHLQLSILNKIKLFYRPLALEKKANDMYKDISWKIHTSNEKSYLTVKNNSGYYASLTEIRVDNKIITMPLDMVPPMKSVEWELKNITAFDIYSGKSEYGVVNDFGAVIYRPIVLQ